MASNTVRRTGLQHPRARDLTGRVFGKLTVIETTEFRSGQSIVWHCRCECGTHTMVASNNLTSRDPTRSCGCGRPSTAVDLTGQVFGRLTAVEPTDRRIRRQVVWRCRCECGVEVLAHSSSLVSHHIQSCGCLRRDVSTVRMTTHGATIGKVMTHEYKVWRSLRYRCKNPESPMAPRYVGRGITVCRRWDTFANFIADMGPCPTGMTIERIDNDGHYEPGNCKWATYAEQSRNRCNTRNVTLNGVTMCLTDWAVKAGIPINTVRSRLREGWPMDQAIGLPVMRGVARTERPDNS